MQILSSGFFFFAQIIDSFLLIIQFFSGLHEMKTSVCAGIESISRLFIRAFLVWRAFYKVENALELTKKESCDNPE